MIELIQDLVAFVIDLMLAFADTGERNVKRRISIKAQ